ncbi:hypothetical protein DFH94DRAFT_713374 [Russula ochroleuca]|uniref:Uncharacterized protein n=1 Tax=Russula ochroleuca TaxID=152965 RepID=A0A9P5N548_9AGAM|nr:hypothetical protein DFH94DRAFT_713374 [Russula ochroleuca]
MLSSGISSAVGFVDLTGEWSVFLFALRCACLDTGLLLLQRTMAKPPKGQYECMGASKEMGWRAHTRLKPRTRMQTMMMNGGARRTLLSSLSHMHIPHRAGFHLYHRCRIVQS